MRILLLLFLSYAANLAATTYYVSPAGSDSNPGTSSQPWLTMGKAAATAVAGDTVIFADGTYTISSMIFFNNSGTPSSPITFVAQNKWKATLQSATNPQMLNVNGNYNIFKNFEMIGTAGTCCAITLQNAAVGSTAYGSQVIGNKVHDFSNGSSCLSGGAIAGGQHGQVISGNLIYNVSPTRSYACSLSQAIYLVDGDYSTITNNVIVDDQNAQGIQANGDGAHEPNFPSHENITNNTFVNVGNNAGYGGGVWFVCKSTTYNVSPTCDYNNINNNLFTDVQRAPIIAGANCGSTWGTHNLFYNDLEYNSAADSWNNSGYACGTITSNIANFVTSNPLFVNNTDTQTGDYHLQSASTAIDAGTSNGAPSTDFDGNTRPQGTAFDIGAYEFVGSTPSPPIGLTAIVQ